MAKPTKTTPSGTGSDRAWKRFLTSVRTYMPRFAGARTSPVRTPSAMQELLLAGRDVARWDRAEPHPDVQERSDRAEWASLVAEELVRLCEGALAKAEPGRRSTHARQLDQASRWHALATARARPLIEAADAARSDAEQDEIARRFAAAVELYAGDDSPPRGVPTETADADACRRAAELGLEPTVEAWNDYQFRTHFSQEATPRKKKP